MPLEHGKSRAAFEHNVREERKAGKPEDQALAIAYSEQRGDSNLSSRLDAIAARADAIGTKAGSLGFRVENRP